MQLQALAHEDDAAVLLRGIGDVPRGCGGSRGAGRIEVVAAARQANQKRALVARREELDLTWESVKQRVASPELEGRKEILMGLVKEASSSNSDMIMRPVSIDRKSLSSSNFSLGEDIDGLGGFVLESKDGSVVLDYRFDSLLEDAWKANLGPVNKALFGE